MNRKTGDKNFAQSAAMLVAGTLTVKAVSMLFKIPVSNLLGATGYACFSGAYELFNLLAVIALAGFPVAISKLVAENCALGRYRDNRKIFSLGKKFFLATGLVWMTAMILGAKRFAAMIPNPGAELSIICLAPCVLTCCMMSAYRGYYQGMQNMYPTCVSQIIEAVTKLIFGLGFCRLTLFLTSREYQRRGTVLGKVFAAKEQASSAMAQLASAGAVFGVTLSTAAGLIYLVRTWKTQGDGITDRQLMYAPKPQPSAALLRKIMAVGIPVCLGSLAVDLSGVIDLMTVTGGLAHLMETSPQALLELYQGKIPQIEILNQSVHNYLYGAYSGKAMVIANLIPALTAGIAVSALPAVAESFAKGNRDNTADSIELVLRLTAAVCIPAGMGVSALAEESCVLFFGDGQEISLAVPLLKICGIAAVFVALTASLTSLLQAVGMVMLPVKLLLIGSGIKWVMNYFLVEIPQINMKAAALSSLVCYFFITVMSIAALKRQVGNLRLFSSFAVPSLAGGMCAFCARQVQDVLPAQSRFGVLISVFVGVVVYLMGLLVMGGIRKEEIMILPGGEKMAKILEKYQFLG